MPQFRVFDQETARLLSVRVPGSDPAVTSAGELLITNSDQVLLVPSIAQGEVLYLKVHAKQRLGDGATSSMPGVLPTKHYVATGFLGLEGELEEEVPTPPKPWWKRLFVD